MTGIPYARVIGSSRECPLCKRLFVEEFDQYGEQTSNNYGLHYSATHALCTSTNPDDVCEWNQHGERQYCETCYAEAMPYDHHDANGDGK